MTDNAIAREIVDAAFHIHTTLGPGLLESVYHAVLAHELAQRGLRTVSQQPIPVVYGTIRIDTGFRADLIVEVGGSSRLRRGRIAQERRAQERWREVWGEGWVGRIHWRLWVPGCAGSPGRPDYS